MYSHQTGIAVLCCSVTSSVFGQCRPTQCLCPLPYSDLGYSEAHRYLVNSVYASILKFKLSRVIVPIWGQQGSTSDLQFTFGTSSSTLQVSFLRLILTSFFLFLCVLRGEMYCQIKCWFSYCYFRESITPYSSLCIIVSTQFVLCFHDYGVSCIVNCKSVKFLLLNTRRSIKIFYLYYQSMPVYYFSVSVILCTLVPPYTCSPVARATVIQDVVLTP